MAGVGKLFALRAALEKILKPRAALIGKASKKGHHDRKCPIIYSKSSEERKKGYRVRKCPILHSI